MPDNQPNVKESIGNAAKNIGSHGSFNSLEDLDKYIGEQLTSELKKNLEKTLPRAIEIANNIGLEALKAVSPNYLNNQAVSDLNKGMTDNVGIAEAADNLANPEPVQHSKNPDLGALNQGDIAKQALTNNNQQNGATSEGAAQKAEQDLNSVPPPAPASQPHAKEGQEMAQGAEEAAAGGEGMGPAETPGGAMPEQIPPGQERAAKEQLGQEKQKKPERPKKRPQAGAGQPETGEVEEDEPIIPTPADVVASTNVSEGGGPEGQTGEASGPTESPEGESEKVSPEEEQKKKGQLAEEQEQAKEGGEAEPGKDGEGEDEGGEEGQEGEPEPGAEGAEGGEPSQVEGDDEQRQARDKMGEEQGQDKDKEEEKDKDKDSDDKEGGVGDVVAGAVDDTVVGAVNLGTQELLEEVIDSGWEMYGVGWLITWPVLLLLLYLDEKDIGEFDTIFFGKLKPFKLNAFQKMDIYLQLTLAFLAYVALAAQFIMIYLIYSGKITGIIIDSWVPTWFKDW